MNKIRALATDYDETIAVEGSVSREVEDALWRLREAGFALILDTGRGLQDLDVFPRLHLFHRVVAENGGVLFHPETGEERLLGPAPPPRFVTELERRHVSPLGVRQVVIEAWRRDEARIREAMHAADANYHIIFNKEAAIVLPFGVDKGSGLRAALKELQVTPGETAAIGDAENDFALLEAAALPVAVPNAIPELKGRARRISTALDLIEALLANAVDMKL